MVFRFWSMYVQRASTNGTFCFRLCNRILIYHAKCLQDNIATHPELGMRTTAGSLALEYSIVQDDAVVITKVSQLPDSAERNIEYLHLGINSLQLRKAGAIILGKTNMSEWANIRGSFGKIPNGWSARGGQTQSAYVTGPFKSSERVRMHSCSILYRKITLWFTGPIWLLLWLCCRCICWLCPAFSGY